MQLVAQRIHKSFCERSNEICVIGGGGSVGDFICTNSITSQRPK